MLSFEKAQISKFAMWKLRKCSEFSRHGLYFVPTETNISELGSGVLVRVAEPIGFEVELKTQQFSTILNNSQQFTTIPSAVSRCIVQSLQYGSDSRNKIFNVRILCSRAN